jgi:hypothetical protein
MRDFRSLAGEYTLGLYDRLIRVALVEGAVFPSLLSALPFGSPIIELCALHLSRTNRISIRHDWHQPRIFSLSHEDPDLC